MRRRFMRLLKRTKRNCVICVSIIAFSSLILWSDILQSSGPEPTISCHFTHSNNSLPVLKRSSNLPSRSIFFYATACPGNLTSRQYCSIESAAVTHPEWQINVVFTGPTVPLENWTQEKFYNIKFWRIHIEEFSKGTPLEKSLKRSVFKKCRHTVEVGRDVLKYLTLATWGGIYLDLDIVVAQPLGALARNWAARESDDAIGDGVMAFSRDVVGRNISEIAVKEMQWILRRGDCVSKRLMTDVLKKVCSTSDALYMSSATCNGFEVYGPHFFHPIPEIRAREYFIPGELWTTNAYTYHLWDHITKKYKVMRTSPLAKIARRFCPLTFKLYSDQFGL